jgi:hypothetical protein
MRMQRSTLAVAAAVLTFAGGSGVAWACGAGSGYPGGTAGMPATATTQTAATRTGTTITQAPTAGNSSTSATSAASNPRRRHHSARHTKHG